jgi:hypothetical protein
MPTERDSYRVRCPKFCSYHSKSPPLKELDRIFEEAKQKVDIPRIYRKTRARYGKTPSFSVQISRLAGKVAGYVLADKWKLTSLDPEFSRLCILACG